MRRLLITLSVFVLMIAGVDDLRATGVHTPIIDDTIAKTTTVKDVKSYAIPTGYFTDPFFLGNKILVSNDAHSTIYIIEDSTITPLITMPGCGYKYTISYDQKMIGLKIINEKGYQTPAVFDLSTKTLVRLHEPVPLAGQVSFSNDGKLAFTIGNELIVRKGSEEERINLGVYSNLARISPNGEYVVYNDDEDQIWMTTLKTSKKRCLTDKETSYFDPLWSQDSRKVVLSTLNGKIQVCDLRNDKLYSIGEGRNPSWSPDGEYLVYYIAESDGPTLTSSEIFLSRFDGSEKTQITNTPDVMEMDPRFSSDGGKLIFHTQSRREVREGTLEAMKLVKTSTRFKLEKSFERNDKMNKKTEINYEGANNDLVHTTAIDVPYIHQVYDAPDWFYGSWACAPTTALMAIVYYRKLPHWDIWCTWPYGHTSHWGRYICEKYTYNGVTYDLAANGPPDNPDNGAKGGFGYMWGDDPSRRPSTTMHNYLNNHGLTSWHDDGVTWSEAVSEFTNNYPYGLCVGLDGLTEGHLVLGIGYVSGQHTVICNDPYGDANTLPWKDYNGKNVLYDWPGYNNGYRNLNPVYWAVGARGVFPAPSDSIVDDLAIDDGFYMYTAPPATMAYWGDALIGYRGHMWWTYTTVAPLGQDTCYVTWTPNLSQAGNYEVSAYIPSNYSSATSAKYKIYYNSGNQTVTVNQNNYSNVWVSLGTYPFGAGQGGYVRLGDATGIAGQKVGFDAIKWRHTTDVESPTEMEVPSSFALMQNYPNPFNQETMIGYALPKNCQVQIVIYNVIGQKVKTLINEFQTVGQKKTTWDGRDDQGNDLASGTYFYRLQAGDYKEMKKMALLK
jgi:hypothetical protein